jgi:hypothetical protein
VVGELSPASGSKKLLKGELVKGKQAKAMGMKTEQIKECKAERESSLGCDLFERR